jgi:hypothetical protein
MWYKWYPSLSTIVMTCGVRKDTLVEFVSSVHGIEPYGTDDLSVARILLFWNIATY